MTTAQQKQPHAQPQPTHTIHFQLTPYNNIAVKAILNQQDTVVLMFHTAANSMTLTEATTQKLKSLRFEGADSVKSWGGADNTSRFSKGNQLQIGSQQWQDVAIWENKNSGQNTDGKFGTDLFANQVIEINFDQHNIIIHPTLPRRLRKYQKLKLTFENDMLFLQAACTINDTALPNKFLIHSGYAGAVLLDDKFTNNNKISEKLAIVSTKELKDSYGNVLKTRKAILPAFTIGNLTLQQVPVGFFEGAIGRQKMSIIGGDILKRFNWIIDAQRNYVYLKPSKLKNSSWSTI
jgi:hypothetical protein